MRFRLRPRGEAFGGGHTHSKQAPRGSVEVISSCFSEQPVSSARSTVGSEVTPQKKSYIFLNSILPLELYRGLDSARAGSAPCRGLEFYFCTTKTATTAHTTQPTSSHSRPAPTAHTTSGVSRISQRGGFPKNFGDLFLTK